MRQNMFPIRRMRRSRSRNIQPLLRETAVTKRDLVAPLFVDENLDVARPIAAMPGQFRYPVETVAEVAEDLKKKGIHAVLLFGIPKEKDERASSAFDPEGIVQKAVHCVPILFYLL